MIFNVFFVLLLPIALCNAKFQHKHGIRGSRNDHALMSRQLQDYSVRFSLYNALTDTLVVDLSQGASVNIGSIPPGNLNIVADVVGPVPTSVKMTVTGAKSFQVIEGAAPYALCGNFGNDFLSCDGLTLGKYTVGASLYSGKKAKGTVLFSANLDFDLTIGSVPPPPQPTPTAPQPTPTVPVPTPTVAPPTSCSIPKIVGQWEPWAEYPIPIGEGMGALIGDDFVIVSGFSGSFSRVTKKVYAFNTKDPKAIWREMDDVPVPGFSHAAFAVDNLLLYICGAYVGPTPGPESKICLKFNPAAPAGKQWVRLPDMPEGRGAGGLNHIKETNSLVYAAGATRTGHTVDFQTTFELDLDNLAAGWTRRQDIPYKGNHISHVTAYYQGKPHYYWAGGQLEQQESNGNQNDLVEWDQATKTWIKRTDMTIARGHASTSTVAYGCGFIMAGGAINTGSKTDNISYYGIDTNKWTSIGKLPQAINTPVCDIVRNISGSDWIYCQTGNVGGKFNWRIKISN